MTISIGSVCNALGTRNSVLAALITALLTDLTATRAEVVKLQTDVSNLLASHNTLATKLNADATVTDTNYAAGSAITAAAPAALTVTA